jgi:hypothetical protein
MTTSLARGTSCHKAERTCRVSYRNRLRTGMMDLTLTQVPLCRPLRRLSHGILCIEVVKQRRGRLLLHPHRHRPTDLIRQHRYRNRCCTPWGGDPTASAVAGEVHTTVTRATATAVAVCITVTLW